MANTSVAAEEVKGTVLIKVNGKFVPFEQDVIKNGSELDTRKGTVEITTSDGEKAQFFDGIFKISQTAKLTTLTLTEALDCSAKSNARAAAKKPKSRSCGATARASSAPRASTARPPCAAPSGWSRTRARPRSRG